MVLAQVSLSDIERGFGKERGERLGGSGSCILLDYERSLLAIPGVVCGSGG